MVKSKDEIFDKISNCKGKCWCYDLCLESVDNADNTEDGLKLVDYATRCANKNVESK